MNIPTILVILIGVLMVLAGMGIVSPWAPLVIPIIMLLSSSLCLMIAGLLYRGWKP